MGAVTVLRSPEQFRTTIPVARGRVLARQGRPCPQFAIVVEGTVQVTRDGRELARLGAGQMFGEIGIVCAVTSPVTIVACTALLLDVMSVREFHSAYTTMPAFRAQVDHEIDDRIATWFGPCVPFDADYTLAS
jgi:CRP-like cAMP-binding protein